MASHGQRSAEGDLSVDASVDHPPVQYLQGYNQSLYRPPMFYQPPNPLHMRNLNQGYQVHQGHYAFAGVPSTMDHYDVALLFAKADQELVEDIMEKMTQLELKDGTNPKVCLSDDPLFDASASTKAEPIVKVCTLVFVVLTENLREDYAATIVREEAIGLTRLAPKDECDPRRRYCVRPLHTKSEKERKGLYRVPCGLTSIDSIDWYQYEKPFFKRKLKQLFEFYLPYRLKREMELQVGGPVQTAGFNFHNNHPASGGSSGFQGYPSMQQQQHGYYHSGPGYGAQSGIPHNMVTASQCFHGSPPMQQQQGNYESSYNAVPGSGSFSNVNNPSFQMHPSHQQQSENYGHPHKPVPESGALTNNQSNMTAGNAGSHGNSDQADSQPSNTRTADSASSGNQEQHSSPATSPAVSRGSENERTTSPAGGVGTLVPQHNRCTNIPSSTGSGNSSAVSRGSENATTTGQTGGSRTLAPQHNSSTNIPSSTGSGTRSDDHSLTSRHDDMLFGSGNAPADNQTNATSPTSEMSDQPIPEETEGHPSSFQRGDSLTAISSFGNLPVSDRTASVDGFENVETDMPPSFASDDHTQPKKLYDSLKSLNVRDQQPRSTTHVSQNIEPLKGIQSIKDEDSGFMDGRQRDEGSDISVKPGDISADCPSTLSETGERGSSPDVNTVVTDRELLRNPVGMTRTPGDGQSLCDSMGSKTVTSQTSGRKTSGNQKTVSMDEPQYESKAVGTETELVMEYDGPAHESAAKCAAPNKVDLEKEDSRSNSAAAPIVHLHYMAGQYVGGSQNPNFFQVPPEGFLRGFPQSNTGVNMPYPGVIPSVSQAPPPINISNCQNVQIGRGEMYFNRAPGMSAGDATVQSGNRSDRGGDDDDDDDSTDDESLRSTVPNCEDNPPPYSLHDPSSRIGRQRSHPVPTSNISSMTPSTLVKQRISGPDYTPVETDPQTRPVGFADVAGGTSRSNMPEIRNTNTSASRQFPDTRPDPDQPPSTLFGDCVPSGPLSHLNNGMAGERMVEVANTTLISGTPAGQEPTGEALPELELHRNELGVSDFSSWTVPSLHDTGEDLVEMLQSDDSVDNNAKGETTHTQKKIPRTTAGSLMSEKQTHPAARDEVGNFQSMFCPNKRREDVYVKTGKSMLGTAGISSLRNVHGEADVD